MVWVKLLVQMLLFAVIVLVVYNVLKYYVLSKIKINKWIVFAVAVIVLILPNILVGALKLNIQNNVFWIYGPSSLFIVLFLWFIDLSGWNKRANSSKATTSGFGKKSNKKDVIIRPKAKPNRVKNKKD
ncbi:hypothetical protein NBE98_01105 [Clostridium swellfunianum]|uniref:hypothetical protein n=1 Tax=Clostridium swellfunianum TaxID=1367462 RepID=UPI0020308D05|nr:hypothetical protein [Clostridium swellfunianum]MCM0646970.1 hypothetical protein [Clostridium swellfunianum]